MDEEKVKRVFEDRMRDGSVALLPDVPPLLGKGEPPPVYTALLFGELMAQRHESDAYLLDQLCEGNPPSPGHVVLDHYMTDVVGSLPSKLRMTQGLLALVRTMPAKPWYLLLMYWQAIVLAARCGIDALDLRTLEKLQQDAGSDVWPAGDKVMSRSAAADLWNSLRLSEQHHLLQFSAAWTKEKLADVTFLFDAGRSFDELFGFEANQYQLKVNESSR